MSDKREFLLVLGNFVTSFSRWVYQAMSFDSVSGKLCPSTYTFRLGSAQDDGLILRGFLPVIPSGSEPQNLFERSVNPNWSRGIWLELGLG